jgi:hypothetical protein
MNSSEFFQNNGFVVVKSVISQELRDFITQYALFDEMQDYSLELNNVQVANSHSKYADPAMETVLLSLSETMEKNTELSLSPTYSYYRIYRHENELLPHTDRPSCEISATLCFNYSYNKKEYEWPIYMKDQPIVLGPGDIIIYRGYDLTHYRKQFLPPDVNDWQVQGFFHFVDNNGPFSEFKFDKRNSIGEPIPAVLRSENQQVQKPYITYL